MEISTHIRLKTRLLPVLVFSLLAINILAPHDVWLVLLVALGGAWLLGYGWVRLLAKNLHLHREMRFGWAQVGDRLEERFILTNSSWLPALWVEVADHSTLPGYLVSRVTGIGAESRVEWHTEGTCNRRGLFQLGPTSLVTSDPLGIISLEIFDPRTVSLAVMPPIVPLPFIEVAAGGRAGEGRPRPDAPERTVSAASVRAYMPGDSLRWIHWRTSAHRDEWFVRLFEGTPAGDWWIILDLDENVQAGQGQDSTEEWGVILAASLADRGLRSKKAVGLAANSWDPVWLPPQEGAGQRWEILRALALSSPDERSLADFLARMKPSFGKNASLVLITANTNGDWIERLLPLLWAGAVPTVVLLDPESFAGAGKIEPLLDLLNDLGIHCYRLGRELLDLQAARPGRKGRWDWRVSPFGRAIAVNRPDDQSWRPLS